MAETDTAVKVETPAAEPEAIAEPTAAPPKETTPIGAAPGDGTPAEGEKPAPAPGPTYAWSDKGDPYDVLDLPDFQEPLTRRDERTRSEVQAAERQRFEQATANWEATQAYSTIAGLHGTVKERLEDAIAAGDEGSVAIFERALGKIEKFAERYDGAFERTIRGDAAAKAREGTVELLSVGLSGRARAELRTFIDTKADSWPAALKERDRLLMPSIREELEKEVREQMEEEARAKGREVKGNPAVPAGGGGGGGRMTHKQLMALPPEEYEAVPEAEKRAIFAAEEQRRAGA